VAVPALQAGARGIRHLLPHRKETAAGAAGTPDNIPAVVVAEPELPEVIMGQVLEVTGGQVSTLRCLDRLSLMPVVVVGVVLAELKEAVGLAVVAMPH
jgi:hypothetical protein